MFLMDFPGSSDGKVSAYNAGDLGSIPGSGRSPGEGNGNPLQYSCLENPMDRGAWWATIHGVAKSWTGLSDFCVCMCLCVISTSCVHTSFFLLFMNMCAYFIHSFFYLWTYELFTVFRSYKHTITMNNVAVQSLSHVWLFATSWTAAC